MFSCSTRTIVRHMKEHNVMPHNYSCISDMELDTLIENVTHTHPCSGEKMILGSLRAQVFRFKGID